MNKFNVDMQKTCLSVSYKKRYGISGQVVLTLNTKLGNVSIMKQHLVEI